MVLLLIVGFGYILALKSMDRSLSNMMYERWNASIPNSLSSCVQYCNSNLNDNNPILQQIEQKSCQIGCYKFAVLQTEKLNEEIVIASGDTN